MMSHYNIRRKLGRPPGAVPLAERRRRFDVKHWPDAWRQFLQDSQNEKHTWEEVAVRYRLRQFRQSVHWHFCYLGGGRLRLRRRPTPLFRRDITRERIEALAKRGFWLQAIAATLNTSAKTVKSRLNGSIVIIPRYLPPLKRPDVTPAIVAQCARQSRSVLEMCRRLKVSHITILRRAHQKGLKLPNGRSRPHKRTETLLRRIRELGQQGYRISQIAAVLGINRRSVSGLNDHYHLGLPVRRRQPGRRRAA